VNAISLAFRHAPAAGPVSSVTTGPLASLQNERAAGLPSGFPARSRARTSNVCAPSARLVSGALVAAE
jgi:hypothetical protein